MVAVEPQFVRFDDLAAFELARGIGARPLFGEGAMLNLVEFEPGAKAPSHSHEHEQLGIVLRGMCALVVEGVAHELRPSTATGCRAGSSTPPIAARMARWSWTSSGRCGRTTASTGRPYDVTRTRPADPARLASTASLTGPSGNGGPAIRTRTSSARGSSSSISRHLERAARPVKEGGSSLQVRDQAGAAAPSASRTAAHVVTVATFWSA